MATIEIDSQDRNTILAALRTYQAAGFGEPCNRPLPIHDIATNMDCEISMDDAGIDDLCERLNVDCNYPLEQEARCPDCGTQAVEEAIGQVCGTCRRGIIK